MIKKTPWLESANVERDPISKPSSQPDAATLTAMNITVLFSGAGRRVAYNARAIVKHAM